MLSFLVFVLMFGGAFLTALLAASFYWASLHARGLQPGAEPALDGTEPVGQSIVLRDEDLSTIVVWRSLLERFSHVEELRRMIAEANLKWSVGRATLMMLLAGSATAMILWHVEFVPLLPAVAIVGMVASLPYFYISRTRSKRFEAFANQFPEALDSLTRALKSGYPLGPAMELLAMEQPEPLASEMRKTREEWNLGVSWDHALDNLAARIPLPEVHMFVAAVKLQNKVGGRLNDVLARLSETMRDNASLESEVRAIAAHSKITGLVLTVLPWIIGILMFISSPEYMSIMFRRSEGRLMLGCVVLGNIVAHFVIRRVARVRL